MITQPEQAEHIANIGACGADRRRTNGVAWLAIAVVAATVLLATSTPRVYRLLLVIPFGLAATGWLQAREKT